MKKLYLAQPAATGSGTSVSVTGLYPLWLHVSGTVAAQAVVEGSVRHSASVNDGPYYTMTTVGAAGMFQLTGLAEVVRLTMASGSSPNAKFTLVGIEESK